MTTISYRTRTLLPATLTLALASLGVFAAPPQQESPIDREPATQMTPETPPKASTAMIAQPTLSGDAQAQFDLRDTNHDGYVDKSEAHGDAKLLSQFNTLDADKDGKLSATEFMNAKNLAKLSSKHPSFDRH